MFRLNPTPKALASPFCSGAWELRYTTSASILGLSKPKIFRPSGKILQVLDTVNLKARNIESSPFYNQVRRSVNSNESRAHSLCHSLCHFWGDKRFWGNTVVIVFP